jgi:hypothetical protein
VKLEEQPTDLSSDETLIVNIKMYVLIVLYIHEERMLWFNTKATHCFFPLVAVRSNCLLTRHCAL